MGCSIYMGVQFEGGVKRGYCAGQARQGEPDAAADQRHAGQARRAAWRATSS